MLNVFLMFVLIMLATFQSLLCRQYSDRYPGKESMASPVFTIVSGLVVIAVSLVLCKFQFHASLPTVILGVVNSLVLYAYNYFIIKASVKGPYSILIVFSLSGAIVIPVLVDVLFFNGKLSLISIICILVVLFSVYLVSIKEDEEKTIKKGFWLACAGLCLSNGIYGSFIASQQQISGVAEKEEMVAITYLGAVVLSVLTLAFRAKKEFFTHFRQTKSSCFYLVTASIVIAAALHLLTFMIDLIDLAILYTFDSSSVIVVSVLISWIFFKEKLSWKNIVGCVTMCAALISMSLFG